MNGLKTISNILSDVVVHIRDNGNDVSDTEFYARDIIDMLEREKELYMDAAVEQYCDVYYYAAKTMCEYGLDAHKKIQEYVMIMNTRVEEMKNTMRSRRMIVWNGNSR